MKRTKFTKNWAYENVKKVVKEPTVENVLQEIENSIHNILLVASSTIQQWIENSGQILAPEIVDQNRKYTWKSA